MIFRSKCGTWEGKPCFHQPWWGIENDYQRGLANINDHEVSNVSGLYWDILGYLRTYRRRVCETSFGSRIIPIQKKCDAHISTSDGVPGAVSVHEDLWILNNSTYFVHFVDMMIASKTGMFFQCHGCHPLPCLKQKLSVLAECVDDFSAENTAFRSCSSYGDPWLMIDIVP